MNIGSYAQEFMGIIFSTGFSMIIVLLAESTIVLGKPSTPMPGKIASDKHSIRARTHFIQFISLFLLRPQVKDQTIL
jgi:hypothetical protein